LDWTLAIARNREALQRIVAALFAYAGLANGAAFAVMPRVVYRTFWRVLRPAESAVRRLIFIAALGMVKNFGDSLLNSCRGLKNKPQWWKELSKLSPKSPRFQLIDPLKHFSLLSHYQQNAGAAFGFAHKDEDEEQNGPYKKAFPRISVPGFLDPVLSVPLPAPSPDDLINAARLSRRFAALVEAMADLPKQARRLSRWLARRDLVFRNKTCRKPRRMSPFRPGSPPGARRQRRHEVDHVLRECHLLMLDRLADTS
jgi:hypothetical protein